jgi:DNA-binding PadR family transcriptional regulator
MSPRDMSSKDVPERGKPLSEPVLWLLLSLAAQAQHGYALMKDVERLSEGRVRLSTGTLYGAIRRLVEDSWIEPIESRDKSRDKQAYRLTNVGRAHLKRELERLRHVTRTAASHINPRTA